MEREASIGSKKDSPRWRKLWKWLSIASVTFVLVLVLLGVYLAARFVPERTPSFDTMADHFKYGSTRGDLITGIPYWIWQAMPLVCADSLQSVAGDRLAPDYAERVKAYATDEEDAARRQALSREGFKALGFLYELDGSGEERDLPVGVSRRRSVGLERAYINCAVCHTSTVRESAESEPELMIGMPANLFNLYDFEHFTFQCTKSRYFNALELLPEIDGLGGGLDLLDRYLVYPLAIWLVRDAISFLEVQAGFSVRQPDWGPGRNDTFTNNKIFLYGENWRETIPDWWKDRAVAAQGIGTVDFPSIWLQGPRKRRADGRPMRLHWDGNNDKVEERNLNAALATSALPGFIDHESIECIEQWLETLEPPKYAFDVDAELAEKGAPVYARYCASCHGRSGRDFEGEQVGFVTPLRYIGTDPYRLDNYTEMLALNMATTYAEQPRDLRAHACPGGTTYEPPSQPAAPGDDAPLLEVVDAQEQTYRYKHYRKTRGYANMPLDGVWLRAPYLHNGSVPTLRDLLEPSKRRPPTFYRGNDVYDPENVGFVSTEPVDVDGRALFLFDTSIPGNGNQGHEGASYGTELSPQDKDALLEYLKTF